MTDYSWATQADQIDTTVSAVHNEDLNIYVAYEAEYIGRPSADAQPQTGDPHNTVKLADLRRMLCDYEFQRLETALTRYIKEQNGIVDLRGGPKPSQDPSGAQLTGREQEVMQLIARGYRSREMGDLLGISIHTITTHIKNIYRKLNVSSRSEAIFEAFQQGLVQR